MTLVELLIVLAVVAVVAAVASGRLRVGMDEPASSLPPAGVPDGDLTADDVAAVRFSLGLRGYRMSEVDEVLDRVAGELSRRDAELAELRAQLSRTRSPQDGQAAPPARRPSGPDAGPGRTVTENA